MGHKACGHWCGAGLLVYCVRHLALRVLRVLGLPEEHVVKREHDSGERHAEHIDDDGEHSHGLLVTLALVESI